MTEHDSIVDSAVRETVGRRTEGPAYQGSWASVIARKPKLVRRQWLVRLGYPVGVAVAVLAVFAGGALLRPGGQPATPPPLQFGEPSTPSDAPTDKHRSSPAPASATAAAALRQLATVSVAPAPLAAGQFIYAHNEGQVLGADAGTGQSTAPQTQDHEMWLDPQGMIPLKIVMNGVDLTAPGPKSDHQAEVAAARQFLAEHGPSLNQPTLQWFASLPTEPATLLALLRSAADQGSPWSDDQQIFAKLRALFTTCDIILPTAQRAALYRAMALLTGVTSSIVVMDGRALLAVRHTEANDVTEILFDQVTGHAVGTRKLNDETLAVTYVSMSTQAVVDAVDETS